MGNLPDGAVDQLEIFGQFVDLLYGSFGQFETASAYSHSIGRAPQLIHQITIDLHDSPEASRA